MTPFRRILATTDLSAPARHAAERAADAPAERRSGPENGQDARRRQGARQQAGRA